ncbi:MAG TPA: FtsH protease activity modulator HflK [bacterium]|nr:FtsH protease activity modulator HflK [bacterium]
MSKKKIKIGNEEFEVSTGRPFLWVLGIVVVIVLITAGTSFYTVGANERGIILRFGKYVKSTPPGLHWKIPWGVDELYKVKTQYQYKEEFGFRTARAGVETRYSKADYTDESLILNGDLNITDVKWIVQYTIQDPYSFLFKVRNVQSALRDISESAMREVVGNYSFDETLQQERRRIAHSAREIITELVDKYELGLNIELVQLKDVHPPEPVRPSFNDVNEAKQEQETVINQANQLYNKRIYRAQGEAERVIQEAEGYAINRTNTAEGDVAHFNELYKQYLTAPDITKKRLYLETMEKVLKRIKEKNIIDQDLKSVLPLLNLSGKGGLK